MARSRRSSCATSSRSSRHADGSGVLLEVRDGRRARDRHRRSATARGSRRAPPAPASRRALVAIVAERRVRCVSVPLASGAHARNASPLRAQRSARTWSDDRSASEKRFCTDTTGATATRTVELVVIDVADADVPDLPLGSKLVESARPTPRSAPSGRLCAAGRGRCARRAAARDSRGTRHAGTPDGSSGSTVPGPCRVRPAFVATTSPRRDAAPPRRASPRRPARTSRRCR